jgi:leader peptidase (prepilin peptidase) / N-methyltransferase
MNPETLLSVFLFLFGLAAGSFLNVVIYRVPRKESIVLPGSHCPSCNHVLSAWENIPLLSYLALGAKCRRCKSKISLQYPAVELLTGVCFAVVSARFGFTLQTPVFIVFTGILICLSVIDFQTKLLPDSITLPATLLACFLSIATMHPRIAGSWSVSPRLAFLGMLAGAGPLIFISWAYYKLTHREGLGGGDIKLMLFVGALQGPWGAILTVFLGAFAGTLIGIPTTLIKGGSRHTEIPFGPFLSAGAWISALWGSCIIDWYLVISGIT